MKTHFLTAIVIGAGLAAPAYPEAAQAELDSERRLVDRVRAVIQVSRHVARIHYEADCGNDGSFGPPPLDLRVPPPGVRGMEAMRAVFAGEENVAITENENIIRIRIGNVPEELLQTRIAEIGFTDVQRYYAHEAISALKDTPEVAAAARPRGRQGLEVMIGGGPTFGAHYPDQPHLPATIRDATVDEILDAMAITFEGIIVCAACPDGFYHIDFGVRDFTG